MVVNEALRRLGLSPARREAPATLEELCDLVRAARREEKTILPVGQGGWLASGGRPAAADWLVEMRAFAGVVEITAGDLTAVVRAGTRLAELGASLAQEGLWLPGASAADGTLGGLLASGHTGLDAGPLEGTLSERVLGLTAVDGSGVAARSGGRVVKNVAGYDLHRAHAGAGGALGLLAEITVRLEPRPEARTAVRLEAPSLAAAEAAWRELRARGPDPSAVTVRPAVADGGDARAGPVRLTAALAGDREVVAEARASLVARLGAHGSVTAKDREEAGAGESETTSPRGDGCGWSVTLGTGPSAVFAALERACDLAARVGASLAWEILPERGAVHLTLARGDAGALWQEVAECARRGLFDYRVQSEGDPVAAPPPAWSADPGALRLLARWKEAVDPGGILRPGSYSRERLEGAADYFARPAAAAEPEPAR